MRSVELCSGVIQKSGVMVSLKMCLSSCIDYLFAGLFSFCITGCLAGVFFPLYQMLQQAQAHRNRTVRPSVIVFVCTFFLNKAY